MKQQIRFVKFCAKDKDDGTKIGIGIVIADDNISILSYKPNNKNLEFTYSYSYYDEDKKEFVSRKIEDSQIRCDICGSPEPTAAIVQYDDNKFWITHILCDDCRFKFKIKANKGLRKEG